MRAQVLAWFNVRVRSEADAEKVLLLDTGEARFGGGSGRLEGHFWHAWGYSEGKTPASLKEVLSCAVGSSWRFRG